MKFTLRRVIRNMIIIARIGAFVKGIFVIFAKNPRERGRTQKKDCERRKVPAQQSFCG